MQSDVCVEFMSVLLEREKGLDISFTCSYELDAHLLPGKRDDGVVTTGNNHPFAPTGYTDPRTE